MRFIKVVSIAGLVCGAAFGQTNASSKATAAINTVSVNCPSNSETNASCNSGWVDVMTASIKTSSTADLFVSPSLVTGLYTSTSVKGNGTGSTSQAIAQGKVEVRVLLDEIAGRAFPDTTGGGVTFDARVQTLTANLGFIFTQCIADGLIGCALTPEQITLALDTTSAHSFNFILLNVGTGIHTVKVQARAASASNGTNGGVAISDALYGLGSLTVESVRLVNSFTF
jgi:hypothetical protein